MKNTLLYILLFCVPLAAFSQNETEKTNNNEWNYTITPYLWMTSLKGDLTILNKTVPTDLKFSEDIISNLKMAAMFHAEAKKNKFSIMLDVFYAKLGADGEKERPKNNVNTYSVRLKQYMVETGLGYTFAEVGGLKLDALAGARFFDVNTNTVINSIERSDRDFNFFEPYVGLRFKNDWKKWAVGGRFDVGGFGAGSEISYKYNVLVGYQFTDLFGLNLG
jgi:hypothetical protein